ncbi:MAG: family 1 glycosylhydrolase [Chthoniobacterales bacterium]
MQSTTDTSNFLWGVATSAYQSEGGYNQPGMPHNNWAEWERSGKGSVTGSGPRFWERYTQDFSLGQEMGINAFRMGLEWARIQPTFHEGITEPPPIDETALAEYALRIATCRRYGMEPVITLHHFTHPAWLGVDAWLIDSTVDYFATFVHATVEGINKLLISTYEQPPLRWFITINEPNILVSNSYFSHQFPTGSLTLDHKIPKAYDLLLAAHVRAYNAIHDLYEREKWECPMVSLNTFCSDLYWNDKFIWDLLTMRERKIPRENKLLFADEKAADLARTLSKARLPFKKNLPWYLGMLAKIVMNRVGRSHFAAAPFDTFFKTMEQSPRERVFDFVGLDYYDPFFSHIFRIPTFHDLEFKAHGVREWLMNGMTSKWWDWRCLPQGLGAFTRYYSHDLFDRPVLIAENGMAMRRLRDNTVVSPRADRLSRSEFLKAHVQEVVTAVRAGTPIVGYLHWSLTDNYEWGSFTPRFGLYSLDYQHEAERHRTDHHGDQPSQTYRRLIENARQGLPIT